MSRVSLAREASSLVRWRADPKKVRVAVRMDTTGYIPRWVVTLESRALKLRPIIVRDYVSTPGALEQLVVRALKRADEWNWPGVDLGMGWAYEHPWHQPEKIT